MTDRDGLRGRDHDNIERERKREEARAAAKERERMIRLDPMAASLDDLAWLAQRIERRTRKSEEDLWTNRAPEEMLWLEADESYLDFLMRLLPAKAALEAANIQDVTNRDLVQETRTLATWTIVVAIAAIASLAASVVFWVASIQ